MCHCHDLPKYVWELRPDVVKFAYSFGFDDEYKHSVQLQKQYAKDATLCTDKAPASKSYFHILLTLQL